MIKATELLFVGFNSHVVAVDKFNGEVAWKWTAPKGTGYVAVALDGERLYASVEGYTYCLDAISGEERWHNPLEGTGTGVPCLALAGGLLASSHFAEAEAEARRRQSASKGGGFGSTR